MDSRGIKIAYNILEGSGMSEGGMMKEREGKRNRSREERLMIDPNKPH